MLQNYEQEKHEGIYKCYITNDAGRTAENEAGSFELKFVGRSCDMSPLQSAALYR